MSFLANLVSGGMLGFGASNQNTNTSNQFNQNSTQNQNFDTSSTGNTTMARTLTPYQSAIQSPLFGYISQLMQNPSATLAPFHAAARDSTNQNYAGLGDMLRQQFLGNTGGGSSGKFGSALVQGNLQRLGQLQGVDTSFQQQAAELPLTASSLASNLLGMNFGSTTNTTGSTAGQSSGTSNATGQSTGTSNTGGFNFKI